jgi:multidrug efflux pump subunit AcrA (membrane-fusion protein)
MFAKITIALGAPQQVISMPESVIARKNKDFGVVFVVNGDRVSERKITYTELKNGEIAINSGIDKGEIIVSSPDSELQDGTHVTIEK